MTSKLALWKIFETAFRQGNVVVDLRKDYEQVKKDLEVLEVLKPFLKLFYDEILHNFASSVDLDNRHCISETNSKKIEEWLEK